MSALTREIERLEAQIAYQSQRIGDLEAGLRDLLNHHHEWAKASGPRARQFYHEQQIKRISEILEDDSNSHY